MVRMQTFYTQLQATGESHENPFFMLLQISRASLKKILAVRSELAWEDWPTQKAG